MNNAEHFKTYGFAVLRELATKEEMAKLYEYTLQNVPFGNLKDGQVNGSPSFYQDKEMKKYHQKLWPKLEEETQVKLQATFCYYRTYRKGAILRWHKDRMAAEITASLNIGQQGELWDLWVMDADENAHQITLAPGDVAIYRGGKLNHWRGKLVNADYVSQVIFCFIDQAGKNHLGTVTEWLNKSYRQCRKWLGIKW